MSTTNLTPRSPTRVIAIVILALAGFGGSIWGFIASIDYVRARHVGVGVEFAITLAYGAAILAIALLFGRACGGLMQRNRSEAARRYNRRFMTAMSLYVLVTILVAFSFKQFALTGPLAYALAIAPALPLIGAIAAIGLYLREEPDEFERSIQGEAALWATGCMLSIASVWGFLEMFELVPHIASWAAFPLWSVCLAPGQLLARRRYR